MKKEDRKKFKLMRSKYYMKKASAYKALVDPDYEDYSILDKDADEWLNRLNIPSKYERQHIKTRRFEKPEGSYSKNGRKK